MRFIGSKVNLQNDIREIIEKNTKKAKVFCDIFSGTASIARFFKKDYQIISNDLLHFSFVLQKATIENNKTPAFKKLCQNNINDPITYLNTFEPRLKDLKFDPFIFNHYSPNNKNDRAYFTNENALKIDFIRQKIEEWKSDSLVADFEYYYLLACLIEAVPYVSNIAGTYGAYLKHWDKRAFNKITLTPLVVLDNYCENKSYNKDSNDLIKVLQGDVLYIDPPYNSRQYLPNYHILETISKYDSPEIYGKTGLRPYKEVKSKYCIKSKVLKEFSNLIENADFKYIVVSYSSEGLMTEKEIREVLIKYGAKNSYKIKKIPYRRYKHTKGEVKHNLIEFLFFITKERK